ncbi:MAG: hypothetical protein P8188_07955 [Gemmatimonadota bacterium]
MPSHPHPPRAASWLRPCLLILLLAGASPAAGQDSSAADRLQAMVDSAQRAEAEAAPPESPRSLPSEPALAYADSAELAGYATWGLTHRRRVFEWQHQSSRIIFYAVLFLVFTGVGFSGIQFYRSLRESTDGVRVEDGDERGVSHFELSTGGLKISSPVLGVIILGLSLAFFYLYLVYVYPIAETF